MAEEKRPLCRGFQLVAPPELPPSVIRLISQFAGVDQNSLLCKMVRLSIQGTLHNAFVVRETPADVVVLMGCGATLSIPREDIGGMIWEPEPDTNPHKLKDLHASWLTAVVESRVHKRMGSVEIHLGSPHARSCHRRIRGFELNETKEMPQKAPFFVYVKMYFPYLATRHIENLPDNYMRESAAYTALQTCCPAVAPMCHYSSFNETTGSYCIVLEDLTLTNPFTVTPEFSAAQEKTMLHLFSALAVLHGKFLSRTQEEEANDKHFSYQISPPDRELLKEMVHPRVFYALWREAIEDGCDDLFLRLLNQIYNVTNDEEEQKAEEQEHVATTESQEKPTPKQQPPQPQQPKPKAPVYHDYYDQQQEPVVSAASLTLIHGRIIPNHLRVARDPRHIPNIYVLDWKHCGIGPLEVDLIHAYLLIPAAVRKEMGQQLLLDLLSEYATSLSVFYSLNRKVEDLLQQMRDVAYLHVRTNSFDWVDKSRRKEYIALHKELCQRTTPK